MDEQQFATITALLCEPARAKMLWNLLDGKACTASELALMADLSPTSASNHLTKLLAADLVKVSSQGRHRYFSFARPEVAYAVESLAGLANGKKEIVKKENPATGIKYCRSCYDHIAGYVGVTIAETLEARKLLLKEGPGYTIPAKGWKWLEALNISKDDLTGSRRPLARQCLDWSERRPHIAGMLGAVLLKEMLAKGWFRRVRFSRELAITAKGQKELYRLLGIHV